MSLVGFSARNHRQQVGRRGADDATDDRRTPREIFDPLNAEFCFTLDAAASAENAKCAKFFSLDNSGLSEPWRGERVWCNPPYSDCASWALKARMEVQYKGCPLAVLLMPANRTEQAWWQEDVEPYRDRWTPSIEGIGFWKLSVRFLRGRIRFDRPNWTKPAKGDRPPFGLCLLVWERI